MEHEMVFLILLLIRVIFISATNDNYFSGDVERKFTINTIDANNQNQLIEFDVFQYINIPDNKILERIISNDTNFYLSNHIIPEHYHVMIDLSDVTNIIHSKTISFSGEVSIDFRIISPTNFIDFHAQKPYIKIIDYAFLRRNISDVVDEYLQTIIVKSSYNPSSHIHVLYRNNELSPGNYTLKMHYDYTGDADAEHLFFRTFYMNSTDEMRGKKNWIVATRLQGTGARRLFPCRDEPELTATFTIAIKHHTNYTVLSNMPMSLSKVKNVIMDQKETGEVIRTFNTTPAIPTHLVAFAMLEPNSVHSLSYTELPLRLEFAQAFYDITTMHLQRNQPYILKYQQVNQTRHIAILNFTDHAVANWGLNFYRDAYITYEEKKDDFMHKIEVAHLIAHEIMQQMLYNIMSPSWSNLWLKNGLATLLGIEVVDKIFVNYRIKELYAVQNQYESLHLDTNFIMKPLTLNVTTPFEINSLFSHPWYIKATAILRMLQHVVSEDVFAQGIKIYFETYNNKSATIDDFWTAMQIACNNNSSNKKSNFSIAEMMKTYTIKHHYPILKVKQFSGGNSSQLSIGNLNTSDHSHWWISLNITLINEEKSDINSNRNWIIHLSRNPLLYAISESSGDYAWIVDIVADYSRVLYDDKNWERLAKFLNSDDNRYLKIPILNRAKLIDDSFHLAVAGELSYNIFWNISHYLHKEKDYLAWYPMFKAIEHMSSIFPFSTKAAENIKRNIGNMLSGLLAHIKYQRDPKEDELTRYLRQEAAKWACTLDLPDCIDAAEHLLQTWDDLPDETKFPLKTLWWEKWKICNNLVRVTLDTEIQNIVPQNRILEYVPCVKKPSVIYKFMEWQYEIQYIHTMPVNPKGFPYLFLRVAAQHARNNEMLDLILSNFENIKPRTIKTYIILTIMINNVYSMEQLDKIREFVGNKVTERKVEIEHKLKIRLSQIMRLQYYSTIWSGELNPLNIPDNSTESTKDDYLNESTKTHNLTELTQNNYYTLLLSPIFVFFGAIVYRVFN